MVSWHFVHCFTLCAIWKPWTPRKQTKPFGEEVVNYRTVTKWFEKFRSGWKKLKKLRQGQVGLKNCGLLGCVKSRRGKSDELYSESIRRTRYFTFTTSTKSIQCFWSFPYVTKKLQNFWFTQVLKCNHYLIFCLVCKVQIIIYRILWFFVCKNTFFFYRKYVQYRMER